MSTLTFPPVLTSPRDDAVALHRAFKGFGCDTAAVVNIIAHRNAAQLAFIRHEYSTMYSEVLDRRLSSELSGDLKKAVKLWMYDPAARDAAILRHALSEENDVDLRAATEVLCSRTPAQIQQLKGAYYQWYHAYLESAVNTQASGDHKKLLLAYINTLRYEGPEVDRIMVENDAKALFKAGEKRLGTDEKTFICIFSGRSNAHLAAVSSTYHTTYGNSLEKAIKKETSGLFEFALLSILQCAENRGKYFAKILHKAMKRLGTDERTLTRVIVTRAEIDMQSIKAEYQKIYEKSLYEAVKSETSGNYKAFLLALLGA